MTTDAQTLSMILGGGRKAVKKARKTSHKFSVGMDVIYCNVAAKIVGKEGRTWLVEENGKVWPSNGKDMNPA